MAKFILGGIVTNIAGSVGGTTLRRVPNGFSMYNKIKGTSVAKLLINPRIPQIASIFQRWSSLSDVERAGWNNQATLITFPDKFGTQKNLTGRELFNKANIQLLPVDSSINSASGFTATTVDFTLDSMIMNADDGNYSATISVPVGTAMIMFSAEIANKQIYQPVFKSRKVIQFSDVTGTSQSINLEASLLANFPYIATGYWIALYVQCINEFGMVSVYQYRIAQFA